MNVDINTAYENLANAIVEKAVDDFREALKAARKECRKPKIRRNKEKLLDAMAEIRFVLAFFRSDDFHRLTDIDPEWLIDKIAKEERE